MFGMGLMESDPWEFMVLFAILGAHCIAGQWLCMAVPPRIYYNERWVFWLSYPDATYPLAGRMTLL